ncbi:conserved hypothetical protein [Vibrio nigripulchritudo SO65]|uniref:hypothetical protein n=1 Tax=Vibrio nigripulchritudo TaxID=28173 RepID=UPI0003B191E4|nr:hypothetical protein [Vibrio nigripulchritudo]CCN34460.1 conserved hypothetical protein [Vibrio nigripulchritudo AM115]CCN43283.1 conserved hypothetical protein [Vibrio nigripulchritudo FTn2]CCN63759.1 conserved hypothetical protein [Vibrio nigripulchritudo POn4]CCN77084.1 conserved hypothetical protein [Vibrio nigripulchritudo SO65]
MEKFKIRLSNNSEDLMIEFLGDHRREGYPNIHVILENGLLSKPQSHRNASFADIALATDEIVSLWEYSNGEYELNDDVWTYSIHAHLNNAQVIRDIEETLLKSGEFIRDNS